MGKLMSGLMSLCTRIKKISILKFVLVIEFKD
ncbi:MAG: hypothetical protein JWO09_3310 [Bacteroidetes bacterium]|nr:hypothetical protein [Bacteroidota bacterium]